MYLEKVNSPDDLKNLNINELREYAKEVREFIIASVDKNGGHLSSNLGAVELTIALHYCFDIPSDKLIFDVGHQCYTHKIITGRRDGFDKLRHNGGVTGFPNTEESDCDVFTTGHASTSLSLQLGLARAKNCLNASDDHQIISVIGDGALTGGLAYEAMNDIGESGLPMIIVLNDNEMSISKNVGAMSQYLSTLRVSKKYSRFKLNIKNGLATIPVIGDVLAKRAEKIKASLRNYIISSGKLFEQMGIKYFGPYAGNDVQQMIEVYNYVKNTKVPVIVHAITEKGMGYEKASQDPVHSHGVSCKSVVNSYMNSSIVSSFLYNAVSSDERIVAVSAAMPVGIGIEEFAADYPSRVFDVGIAEEHAVSMCAGLAAGGMKPYFGVYSTFLQRGFDQIIHDVCLNKLPVRFLIDRAGVVGSDGVTHQGVFDLSYLSMIPELTVMSPKDGKEFSDMLEWSRAFDKPLAIRYHRDFTNKYNTSTPIEYGKWEIMQKTNSRVYILCSGSRMLDIAMLTNANVINARFIKPLDTDLLNEIDKRGNLIITMEDNIRHGGFGESVLSALNGRFADIKILAHGDEFINSLSVCDAFNTSGLTLENLECIISEFTNQASAQDEKTESSDGLPNMRSNSADDTAPPAFDKKREKPKDRKNKA